MGCGCKAAKKKKAAQTAAALAAAETMTREEAEELVPLGLKSTVRLPAQVPRAIGNQTLVIAEAHDRRDFMAQHPAKVIRGRNARIPAQLRQQLIARYPGLFETNGVGAKEEAVAQSTAHPEPA